MVKTKFNRLQMRLSADDVSAWASSPFYVHRRYAHAPRPSPLSADERQEEPLN